ncbi:NTP transferase domain-containing protein [Candidatus Magnetaquicoccus inordinatus]|uniref:NTP transferase domain-containing protein n=1 Tax=Candidatus Magnetaquicoccus inordinatus TaxID=2496818 RepID=UPI00102B7BD8|nr:NTP transferase domain-containing protein [Candidatus Magnetaquicoccus inordinatus]
MNPESLQVIVQAGGRGSRLRHHTWNKPKCLVSVHGKTLLNHLFDRFPQARFWVIGDYAFDQLVTYHQINPPAVDCHFLRARGKGTMAGIADAVSQLDPERPLLLVWADLIIGSIPNWPTETCPVLFTTSAFTCRWSATPEQGLQEIPSGQNGVAGLFYFPQAKLLPCPPESGEFVRWFAATCSDYALLRCDTLEELGEFAVIEQNNDRAGFCRFFNKVEMMDDRVVKTVVDDRFVELHQKEVAWYQKARELGFQRIPKIYSESPLIMEKIHGAHAWQMDDLTARERRSVLTDYLDALDSLHQTMSKPADSDDLQEVYLQKTIQRVQSIEPIIAARKQDTIIVNGKKCRNPFVSRHAGLFTQILSKLQTDRFVPIHGDATFSNTLIDNRLRVWFIDPRGYFAKPGIMGDPWYDFAKVYYSAVGGYDLFNRRKFKLYVDDQTAEVLMNEPLFAKEAQQIFAERFGEEMARIDILHGLIWLSLSGYVKDDIDSMIGAFHFGLYWLETGIAHL